MLPSNHPCGPVWRIAPCGTTQVYLARLNPPMAQVHSKGQKSKWADRPMTVAADDLFITRAEALAEYRRRRHAAQIARPCCSLNLSTPIGD